MNNTELYNTLEKAFTNKSYQQDNFNSKLQNKIGKFCYYKGEVFNVLLTGFIRRNCISFERLEYKYEVQCVKNNTVVWEDLLHLCDLDHLQ